MNLWFLSIYFKKIELEIEASDSLKPTSAK